MDMRDLNFGSLKEGETVTHTNSDGLLGIMTQMQNNGLIAMSLNNDKTICDLSVINTQIELQESVTKMNKSQLGEYISQLRQVWKSMKDMEE